MAILILLLLVSFSHAENYVVNNDKCLNNKYGHKKLANAEMSYCLEHQGRSCCTNDDILPIRQSLSSVKYYSSPKTSDQCFHFTSRVLCSTCDADVGTGVSDGSICPDLCQQWYSSCQYDYIDPFVNKKEKLPFCTEESMVCSKVTDSFASA